MTRQRVLMVGMMGLLLAGAAWAAAPEGTAKPGDAKTLSDVDEQARQMLRRGLALLEDRQDERAVRLLEAVPLNFPKSPVRHEADLALAKYYSEKGDYALAVKRLSPIADAQDSEPDQKAEALYRTGICHYGESDYTRALTTLRRVTEEHPWSVFANESYYYIGLCHFQLKRWWKAVESLKMVGTSVPPNEQERSLVESGQRFLVKVHDKDLRILKILDKTFDATVQTESGDTESLRMELFDPEGEYFLGSIKMALGSPVPNDGMLQVKGGDVIRVLYVDTNTQDGQAMVKRLAVSQVVSTAVAGFMDGAYNEYVHGVFAGQRSFVRVKDFDADVSDARDKVKVQLVSRYKKPVLEDEQADVVTEESAPEYIVRDTLEMTLEETEPHSGFFAASLVIDQPATNATVSQQDGRLQAIDGDSITVSYLDKVHIGGLDDPRETSARVEFLTGEIPDVWVAHREVSSEELRARKNLIESKFFLRLAQIFANVGLEDRAGIKADTGIEKVDEIIRQSLKGVLPQDLVEDAYQTKWDLLLAKGDLTGAITTCRTMMSLYPQSSLADLALMQIAKANIESGNDNDAMQILSGLQALNTSTELKAEATFLKAKIIEKQILARAGAQNTLKAMGPAVAAYKECVDKYPNSPFAGEALGKVVDFHLESRDYARCQELLQTVFVDFPDAPFLDEMLLKWGVVLARTGDYPGALEKMTQLLRDYPNSALVPKAKKVVEQLARRAN